MRFSVLGRFEVVRDGETVQVRRAQQRRLLAMLLVDAGRVLSVDRLVDGLWGDRPPATAVKTIHTYVSQLRQLLEPDRTGLGDMLVTEPSGYRLAVDPDRIDAFRFERLAAQGRERLPDDPGGAARLLREALALWMGPPLEEFAGQPFADTEIARLNELRLTAVEDRFDAELMLGRHAAAAGELREHVRAHPLRERLVGQLMLALYRSGRQAEALAAHQRARAMLVDELGVDPGPALRRLEQQILRQDQALEWRARSERQAAATIDSQAAAPNPAPSRDEQRWVTVVRAHVDATDGAEAVAARFPERLRREVRRHGGALVDDGAAALTAVFGAPVAHEDDAQRAVRAMRAVTNFAGSVSLAAAPVTVRAGIATGWVSVVPEPSSEGFNVRGAAVEAAAELAAAARPGEVVVDEATRRACRSGVRFAPAGCAGHPRTWRVVAASAPPPLRPLPDTPLVGRNGELDLLATVWAQTVTDRRPHLVTILGPPGIGKSRLSQQFLAKIEPTEARVLRGRSLPYGDATFGALAQMVHAVLDIGADGSAQAVRWKLEAWLDTFLPEDEKTRAAEYLITLLTVVGDFALPDQQRVMQTSVRRFIETVAARQPTVLVFEDIHWAHPRLLDLVESIAGRIHALPLLVVTVARSELLDLRPNWGGGLPAYTALPLDALPGDQTRELARRLVGSHDDHSELLDTIERASGGNPLFVEELTAWSAEGRHEPEEYPATVAAVIAARLDTLPRAERDVVVDASVMGHTFWRGGLGQLTGTTPDQLDDALESLELRGFVRRQPRSQVPGDREFAFRHDLIAEVAYATLPAAARADKHTRVAAYLERAEDVAAAVLAHHWRGAGDPERAIAYFVEAADQANQGWERARAVALYDQALELLADRDPQRWRRVNLRRAVALQAWAHVVMDIGRLRMAPRADPARRAPDG